MLNSCKTETLIPFLDSFCVCPEDASAGVVNGEDSVGAGVDDGGSIESDGSWT